jgi:hypothetical protein
MSCTSRITVMNRKDTEAGVMTWDELRKRGRNLNQKERCA